jgi:hypothetical protein
MNASDYMKIQTTLMQVGRMLAPLDLDGFIAQIKRTHGLAPVIDPTLYRKAQNNLSALEDVAIVAATYQDVMNELSKVVLQTAVSNSEPTPLFPPEET